MASITLTSAQLQVIDEFVASINSLSADTKLYLNPATGVLADSTPTTLGILVQNSDKTYSFVAGT